MSIRRTGSAGLALLLALGGLVVLGTVALTGSSAQASSVTLNNVVNPVPAAGTPSVDDGTVLAFAQVGTTMVVGGDFTSVAGTARRGVFAFNTANNQIVTGFSPVLDGDVETLFPGPTAGTVYVGGTFATVNGVKSKSLALLDVSTGARVAGFKAVAMNGIVNTLKLVGSHLYVGGTFTAIGGATHGGLASLSPTTGDVDTSVQTTVLTNHNWTPTNGAAKAAVGVTDLDVTPDGATMVIIGNFKTVDALARDQVAVLDLGSGQAVVRPGWRTQGYEPACYSWAYDSYVRDLDIAPDGTWFAIAATGGGNTTLCDTVSRFQLSATGDNVQPVWRSVSGGDSLLSVAIAGPVVYTGGHQRWMNNPNGNDAAGGGAVPRPGLAAIEARNGMPITWNPGRNPRGSGAWAAYLTSAGLWIGSDTDWIGDHDYHRYKLAFFPLAGGAPLADETPQALPGGVYTGGVRRDFTGTSAAAPVAVANPLSTSTTKGSVLIGRQLYYGKTDGLLYRRTFDGTTFGTETVVEPYLDPKWINADTGSGQTFRGTHPNFYAELPSVSSMFYADGTLFYTMTGQSGLYSRTFSPDSGIVAANRATVPGVTLPAQLSGAFLASGKLYYVTAADGKLNSIAFANGATSGSASVVTGPGIDGVDWRSQVFFFGPAGPPNQPPTAVATSSCDALDCTFDGSGSQDPDGTISTFAWDFGDGTTATGATAAHTYGAAGSYTATLTVTDNTGATATATTQATPSTAPLTPIGFRAATGVNKVSAAPALTVPGSVQAGDRLLLIASSGTATTQAAPAGWAQVAQQASSTMLTTIWQKAATASDAGSTVTVTLDVSTKVDVRLLAYSAAGPVSAVQTAGIGAGTTHTAPAATVTASGSWVIRYWADKSSTTTAWTAPSAVTARDTTIGTGSGYISALVADSGAGVATGSTGTSVATTNASSGRDVTATIVLPPAT